MCAGAAASPGRRAPRPGRTGISPIPFPAGRSIRTCSSRSRRRGRRDEPVRTATRLSAGYENRQDEVTVLAGAGCGGPPWVTAVSPDLVAMRWYSGQTPAVAAGQAAALHCAARGKRAVLVATEEADGAQMAQYDCR